MGHELLLLMMSDLMEGHHNHGFEVPCTLRDKHWCVHIMLL